MELNRMDLLPDKATFGFHEKPSISSKCSCKLLSLWFLKARWPIMEKMNYLWQDKANWFSRLVLDTALLDDFWYRAIFYNLLPTNNISKFHSIFIKIGSTMYCMADVNSKYDVKNSTCIWCRCVIAAAAVLPMLRHDMFVIKF